MRATRAKPQLRQPLVPRRPHQIDLSLPEEDLVGDLARAMASFKARALQGAAYVEQAIPGVRCEIVTWDFEHQLEVLLAPDPHAGDAIPLARRRHVCPWRSIHGPVGALRVHLIDDRWLTDEDSELIDDVSTQLRRSARELAAETLLRLDPMTTIHNFTAFRQAAEQELERCMSREAPWKPAGFIFVDMDGLKAFNDDFDYDIGDDAIRRIARILVRGQRNRERGTQLGRFRGDEFCLLLPGADQAEMHTFADALREDIHKVTLTCGTQRRNLRASIGVAMFPAHGHDFDVLRYHAALANGLAKARGGGRVAIFDEYLALDEHSRLRLRAVRSARRARR